MILRLKRSATPGRKPCEFKMSTISESVWSSSSRSTSADHGGVDLAQLGGAEGQRQEQAMGGAAPEADVGGRPCRCATR